MKAIYRFTYYSKNQLDPCFKRQIQETSNRITNEGKTEESSKRLRKRIVKAFTTRSFSLISMLIFGLILLYIYDLSLIGFASKPLFSVIKITKDQNYQYILKYIFRLCPIKIRIIID